MSLVDEYKKQFAWRDWAIALSKCPISPGQKILDLGCGPGELSLKLSELGGLVTGVDGNEELLDAARKRCPQAQFQKQDLSSLNLAPETFDGLWCSFTAAYFIDFKKTFSDWCKFLKKDAWVCIVEVDDLLGHEPLSKESRKIILEFYEDALGRRVYDFNSGRKIQTILGDEGFRTERFDLQDRELSFSGPADQEVMTAWRARFQRMGGLKNFLKEDFGTFVEEFIQSISSKDHRSLCRVVCVVGRRL
jgi:ubiquinone/menaquinone biosynthesis C-methylase UbiE